MNGRVDSFGRALVIVAVRPTETADLHEIEVWIDTGFNGDLVVPRQQIDELKLPQSGTLMAMLADGSEVALQRYTCLIDWFGEERTLEVVARDGNVPLLGVGLLAGHDLHISYRAGNVTIV